MLLKVMAGALGASAGDFLVFLVAIYFPRSLEISSLVRSMRRHSIVAPTTLKGLSLPKLLVSTFLTPAASSTARTPPPAITPVPGAAGFIQTLPERYFATISCGMVSPTSGNLSRFFLACALPFWIEDWTSLALPRPEPTVPAPSPTTTKAENEKRLPPLTTLATRLSVTTVSLKPDSSRCWSLRGPPRPRCGPPRPPPRCCSWDGAWVGAGAGVAAATVVVFSA